MTDLKCGTHAGYRRHLRQGEPTCQPCRDAKAEYQRQREADMPPCTYEGCSKPCRARGLCGTHLNRVHKLGSVHLPSHSDKFWKRVETGPVPDAAPELGECWLWAGGVSSRGYGNFHPKRGQWGSAHRWAYEALRADIPAGLQIDHLCRVTRCVNPWHMDPVTAQENLRREHTARRTA